MQNTTFPKSVALNNGKNVFELLEIVEIKQELKGESGSCSSFPLKKNKM